MKEDKKLPDAEASLPELKELLQELRDVAAELKTARRPACNENFRVFFEQTPIGLFLASLDGALIQVNPALVQLLGFNDPEGLLAERGAVPDLFGAPSDYGPLLPVLYKEGVVELPRIGLRRRDGQEKACALSLRSSQTPGFPGRVTVGAVVDLATWFESDPARLASDANFKSLFDKAAEGLFQCSPTGEVLVANQAFLDLFGYDSFEELKRSGANLGGNLFSEANRFTDLARRLRQEKTVSKYLVLGQCKNQAMRWLSINANVLHDQSGEPLLLQGSVQDASEQKKIESRLLHESFYDSLTGLVNRPMFLNLLEKGIARAKRRENFSFGLVVLSIDRFRVIKESLGHALAETLLGAVSKLLLQCLRTEDICARLGGDEFALYLSDVREISDIIRVIERINAILSDPLLVEGQEVFVALSSGIVLSSREYSNAENMLNDADTALYRATNDPTQVFAVFNEAMQREALERLKVETDLRRALSRDEFRLYYQPIVSLKNGEIMAFEALIRWERPEVGIVQPDQFVPLLERMGLIIQVGEWALREACRQTKIWREQFPKHKDLMISVNLSPKQLASPDLVEHVRLALLDSELPASALKLEITESLLMEHPENSCKMLEAIKRLGVSVSIDDFGSGYSSLSYLNRLPTDFLKIDKSFTRELQESENGVEIVRAIVALAHTLNKKVIAEGVETSQQLAKLLQLGCEYVQGYYFSKPIPANDVEMMLAIGLRP
jgi:diguanylate cyclase (GGDEF)-like protein/PAS domain S-box-containing protein